MNVWTKKSIELANQRDYLDQLYKVYPMSSNLKRELSNEKMRELEILFDKRDNKNLIKFLLEQELFPIKDSYVSYLRRDPSAIKRNPKTVNRLAGIIYEMGLDETIINMTLPKETNRQIGPMFSNWISKGSLGVPVTSDVNEFIVKNENIILDASDATMKTFAQNHLGYNYDKGLDFIAKFSGKYILGEAKFLTDFGGHQNAQLADALSVVRHPLSPTRKDVIKIAILDGVIYIPSRGKMYRTLIEAEDDEVIISSLLLRSFLYSL